MGASTLTARGHPQPLRLGTVCETSSGGSGVDLLLAIIAGGSLGMLGLPLVLTAQICVYQKCVGN